MNTYFKFSLMLSLILALASCQGVDKGKTAIVKSQVGVKAIPTIDAKKYSISAGTITWIGSKKVTGASHEGIFEIANGNITAEGDAIKSGEFVIDMNSLKNLDMAANPEMAGKLVGHLKSKDFFEVEKYPKSTFAITGVKKSSSDGTNFLISGDLTMKGKTNNVSIPTKVTLNDDGTIQALTNKFSIDRMDWNIEYGSGLKGAVGDNIISDNVGIQIQLKATPIN